MPPPGLAGVRAIAAGAALANIGISGGKLLFDLWRDADEAGRLKIIPALDKLATPEAREATSRLRYNSLINVVIGSGEDRGSPYTAIYVPDPDIVFHRLSFPKAFSERCVPVGSSSIMAASSQPASIIARTSCVVPALRYAAVGARLPSK